MGYISFKKPIARWMLNDFGNTGSSFHKKLPSFWESSNIQRSEIMGSDKMYKNIKIPLRTGSGTSKKKSLKKLKNAQQFFIKGTLFQCCGSKYIEFGSRILAQFGSGSRVTYHQFRKKKLKIILDKQFSLKTVYFF